MAGKSVPTVADLVVLGLLAERPRHGYDINAELVRREVKDWAGVSRPQVYYSLKKASEAGWIALKQGSTKSHDGPDRQVYCLTTNGCAELAKALDRPDWATYRAPPPFLTWLALSSHAKPGAISRIIGQRRRFLEAELAREQGTLTELRDQGGPNMEVPILMVDLTIRQFELELAWLDEVLFKIGQPVSSP